MSRIRRFLRWAFLLSFVGLLAGGAVFGVIYYSVSSNLPDVQSLRNVELQEPLYVYARDGRLMGLFGETRRYPVKIEKVPKRLKDAFIAIEDARFYEHGGVDYKGVARAIWQLLTTDKERVAGGSTITQQVAKMFFLSSEYSYKRKFSEMLLARKMEEELTKDEIFELYLNKSFFGNRAYGVAAAGEFYYGKALSDLSLDEMASLAAIPKFPSSGNPLNNPDRAKIRRDYILERMRELKMISAAEEAAAKATPMHASPHERQIEVSAPFVAEMVRQEMIARYGNDVLTKGYHVVTTIDPALQAAADEAVRDGLGVYHHRHGWAKVEQTFELAANEDLATTAARLRGIPTQGPLMPAIVTALDGGNVQAVLANGTSISLGPDAARWTGKSPAALVKRGDLIRVRAIVPDEDKKAASADAKTAAAPTAPAKPAGEIKYRLDQLPRAQSALVSLEADTGALRALVGGYSYAGNKFNNATQARRQPGSSFKPFVYAAAFERGYNPASIVLDAPVVFRMRAGKVWRPQNDGGGFAGPVRVREALVRSRNLVSVRMLDAIGVEYARKYIAQFGFAENELPPNLSISLGTPSLTPLSIARGYAVFANGGFRVNAWFIDEVRDREGKVIAKEKPAVACRGCGGGRAFGTVQTQPTSQVVDGFDLGPAGGGNKSTAAKNDKPKDNAVKPATALPANSVLAPRAIDERIAYQMISMMRDVVLRGTATDARSIGREDIAGKTGSTNNHRDAWFAGTGGNLVTAVWVGKSDNTTLGYREYGGKAALPIWIDYMKTALKDVPIAANDPPEGMVKVAVTASGQLLPTEGSGGIIEYVKVEDLERMETYVDYGAADEAVPSEDSFNIF